MIGSKLAHYQITAHLGSGGMGDVYQATDLKLGRSVAVKLLPEAFSRDSERVARFEREARVLATLNHPNIAAIYGLEESGGRKFLVMELVDGETLAQRIQRSAIPVDEALGIAKQICEGLEAAHEKGIVHRDLKPANIKITPDGKVKVLDFGLAKAYQAETNVADLSNSPTMMSAAGTNAGVILGTAAYMSPEQAKGRTVDKRTDIFAFGCVLYEMLSAQRAFDGEDVTDILSAVLRMEPDWTRLPADVPPPIHKLLRLCLEKDAKKRRRDAGDVSIDIEQALTERDSATALPAAAARSSRLAWIAVIAVALVAATGVSLVYLRPAPKDAAVVRFTIPPPKKIFLNGGGVAEIAISPDGKTVAFAALDGSVRKLWVRALDGVEPKLMPGSDGAARPFWSPDSKFIGFYAGGKIWKIALEGGPPQSIGDVPQNPVQAQGTWNRDGVIIFSSINNGFNGPLYRVSAAGGPVSPLTALKDKEMAHGLPFFLPDGRHFLYSVRSLQAEVAGVYAGSLDSNESKRVFDGASRAIYSAGNLLFVRDGKLMAQPFDPVRLETNGDPFLVADAVGTNLGYQSISASDAGVLAYGGASDGGIQLAWFDRTGRPLGGLGSTDRYSDLRLSPDGKRVALVRQDVNLATTDLWLAELSSGIFSRFTSDAGNEQDPVWSPDSRRIAFWSNRKGSADIYLKTLGGGEETVLFEAPGNQWVDDWTRDGRFIIFIDMQGGGSGSAYALPMSGEDRKPLPLLKDPFAKDEFNASPDGRWIAYNSGESETTQVYVAAFPSLTDRRQVSNDGGGIPKWRADGKELFYLSTNGKMMAVDVQSSATAIETGTPKMLFQTPINVNLTLDQYDVTPDGQKFLLLQPVEQSTVPPITVVVNWLAALHRK